MSALVVDASVVIKWVLPEVHADAARRLLAGRRTLLVPDLLFAEVTNVLWKRARRGELTTEEARITLHGFAQASLEVHPCRPLMRLAFQIASHTGQTAYDSLYLGLAVLQGCPLITADSGLYDALKDGPLSSHLVWVEDAA